MAQALEDEKESLAARAVAKQKEVELQDAEFELQRAQHASKHMQNIRSKLQAVAGRTTQLSRLRKQVGGQ